MTFFKKDKKNKVERPASTYNENFNNSSDHTRIFSGENTATIDTNALKSEPSALILLAGPKSLIGFSWPLLESVTTLGRSNKYADIFISDEKLSKTHFQILNKEGEFYIVDLASTNKTFKNKEKLEPHKEYLLEDNDRIKAGYLIFKFLASGNIEGFSFREMFKQAQTDSLTEIYNRQSLEFKGQEFFNQIVNFSVIAFDVDSFKTINDTYGHLAGDYILKTIAQLTKELIRQDDLFFRYGGDEFCIFTSHNLKVATSISGRIVEKIKNYNFKFEDQSIPVAISIGFSIKEEADKNWKDIYKRADEKCYEYKKHQKA